MNVKEEKWEFNHEAKDFVVELPDSDKASAWKRRVGILGGTFDPIHYAHLAIAEEVRVGLDLTEIAFIPAGQPPHKPGRMVTPAQHRLAMVQLAIATNPHFTCSRIEVDRPGPSYLVDTLRDLRVQWGNDTELYFIIGWDSLEELHTWYDPQGILAQLTHLVAVGRPGYTQGNEYNTMLEARLPGIQQRLLIVSAPQLNISSTDLRQRIAEGRPIKYQTPEAVEQYIARHELYRHIY
jgi:nicotinate-nucleotide adenylyltransferase